MSDPGEENDFEEEDWPEDWDEDDTGPDW